MHKSSSLLAALLFSTAIVMPAFARDDPRNDVMPPPARAPRTSVDRERVNLANEAPATMMGTAQALDGATIRLHDSVRDINARLIGVVAPPLTTPEGVTARSALDGLLKNQTLDCARRDRDRDGSLVMSCSFGGGHDLSEAMLFTGTALFTRTGTVDNDLAVRYRAAEETAQLRRLGLWAQVPAIAPANATAIASVPVAPVTAKAATPVAATASATPVISLAGTPAATQDGNPAVKDNSDSNFAFTTWLEALGLLGALFGMLLLLDNRHTRRARLTHELDTRSDRQILAAALTGELAAARDICEARAALVTAGGEPRWPRLRTYIYQAHAEQVGLLGAVLARQVASIYGQMADYGASNRGATYGNEADLTTPASVSRALVRLCGYIEITLEGLAEVEHTGEPYYPSEAETEQKHASQLARQTQSVPAPLPQAAAKPATVTAPTRVALKRIGRFDLTEAEAEGTDTNASSGPDSGPDDGQPMPVARQPVSVTPAVAKVATPAPVAASVATTPADSPTKTVVETPAIRQTTAAVSRAARRAALQQKARAGSLFKAEQALMETNADLGVEDEQTVDESKSA